MTQMQASLGLPADLLHFLWPSEQGGAKEMQYLEEVSLKASRISCATHYLVSMSLGATGKQFSPPSGQSMMHNSSAVPSPIGKAL